jgi:Uma2 family endonuclease
MRGPDTWTQPNLVYPETDGEPMAENTLQFRWIVTLQGGIDALFRDRPDVFVAGDLFWYPIEGDNTTRVAPDVLVVFGRPKGDRRSYLQWQEANIPPQVVIEVLPPGNSGPEIVRKRRFYERHGVEEFYTYDPDRVVFVAWVRKGDRLEAVEALRGWVSPRLGIRFEIEDGEFRVYDPEGRRFETFLEVTERAGDERRKAEKAQRRAEKERRRAEKLARRADRLAERLRALGVDPDQPE